jgi:hypothetical protein
VPDAIPQSWNGYFMQVRVPYPELRLMLHLTSAILPQHSPDTLPMLLDIDLFRDPWGRLTRVFPKIKTSYGSSWSGCTTLRTRCSNLVLLTERGSCSRNGKLNCKRAVACGRRFDGRR